MGLAHFEPYVDDTTLRDGAQMPGVRSTTIEERVAIATALDELGVERMEMFGAWYDVDRKAAQAVLDIGLKIRIAVWVRASIPDIDDVLNREGLKEIGISHPVSDIHLEHKLGISHEEALERITTAVQYATDHGLHVFFHGEDSTRCDWAFEQQVIQGIIDAGAECYRVCDTVGVGLTTHSQTEEDFVKCVPDKIKAIAEQFKIDIEFHGHDDFGGAVSNTLVALSNGAKWASTTVLGMGERAGNAETEKIIMNLQYHHNIQRYKIEKLTEICQMVSKAFELRIPTNKAIVGSGVFTHQSGIHTDGVIKHPETYEPFTPESVGNVRHLLLGPYSGKAVLEWKIRQAAPNIEMNDVRVTALKDFFREIFETGIRVNPLTDAEFSNLLRMFLIT
ncbi:MAG TPA: hypothetical protein VKK79_17560 [Candidatus Lokiarchaeia archaeon]|nr:hypothetical protein [Candidatus Lokiarchaeia archaeon]